MKFSLLKSCFLIAVITLSSVAWSAESIPQKIHHFTLTTPDSAKTGEAIDVTVEARDKDDKVISTYHGSVFFQAPSDFNATLPSQGKAILFTESDKWVKKLSKAVIFKKVWEQSLEVSDAVEDASGKKSIRVDAATDTSTASGKQDSITIITPANNDILNMGDFITVSGYSKKNSKVNIKLNGSDIATVPTDENWLYSKTLPTLTQQSNIIVTELLDGTNKVTSSTQVRFSLSNTNPVLNSLTIAPNATIEISTPITLTIDADPGLSEVSITLDGSVIIAKEGVSGKYIAQTVAPSKVGSYPLTINLKNTLSQWTSKPNAGMLTVTAKPLPPAAKFTNVKAEMQWKRIVFTFGIENLPPNLTQFKIAYGMSSDSLSEQVITKNIKEMQTTDGKYSWYIDNLESKNYTFRIFGMKADQSLITDLSSEAITMMIGTPGCTIGNVGDIHVQSTQDKSVLSWMSVSGALSYNIYRYTAAWDPEFIQNTKDTSYILFLSSGAVIHEDFGVKALCDEKTESADMTKVSKVQTGPWALAIIVVISALLAIFIMRRKTSL